MGQKLSVSQEQQNELYNLFQPGQPQQQLQESPKTSPAVMMRMMAPTALGPQQRGVQPGAPVRKQRARKPAVPARKQRRVEPAAKGRSASVRQAQQAGQYH